MRDLNKIFNPKSVAIVGATAREKSVGLGVARNILEGAQGQRSVFFVNPNQPEILGQKTYSKIIDIQEEIDLAVIVVPAPVVSQIVDECVQKKVGGVVIISAGFSEIGKEGQIKQDEIVKKVKDAGIPLIGPNCLGVINTSVGLNASFAPRTPKKGEVAFVSQSGALLDILIDGAEDLGVSCAISYGNEADVGLLDVLEWLENDQATKVIALYVEAIKDGRRFMDIASKIVKTKPIIALKAGKFESSSNAVKSHTGSMAGDYKIYNSAFKQSGVIEIESIEEMLDVAKLLAWQNRCKNSFGIITNGGGCGVLATDYCKINGINLAKLSSETVEKISANPVMSPVWSKSNPADIVGDASPMRYKATIEAVLVQEDISGVMVIQTPQIMTEALENARVIIEAHNSFPSKPIVCFFLGGKISQEAIKLLQENKIPNYSELKRGIKSLSFLAQK